MLLLAFRFVEVCTFCIWRFKGMKTCLFLCLSIDGCVDGVEYMICTVQYLVSVSSGSDSIVSTLDLLLQLLTISTTTSLAILSLQPGVSRYPDSGTDSRPRSRERYGSGMGNISVFNSTLDQALEKLLRNLSDG
jgi:hypothetical protein